jgi:hypothetical protein
MVSMYVMDAGCMYVWLLYAEVDVLSVQSKYGTGSLETWGLWIS